MSGKELVWAMLAQAIIGAAKQVVAVALVAVAVTTTTTPPFNHKVTVGVIFLP